MVFTDGADVVTVSFPLPDEEKRRNMTALLSIFCWKSLGVLFVCRTTSELAGGGDL